MENEKKICGLTDLLNCADWGHAFIKEIYLVSPTYVVKESMGTVSPDYLPTAKIAICIPDRTMNGIELTFEDIEEFSIPFNCDLDPIYQLNKNEVIFSFNKRLPQRIRCKNIEFKLFGEEIHGNVSVYGKSQ